MLSQGRGVYSSITIYSRYIHVVVLLLLLVITRCNCNHDAQGHVCSNSMWGSNTDDTFGRGVAHKYKYKSTHWSHWSERVSLGKQSLHPTCSAHCIWLSQWKPVEYIVMLSHIGIQCNTLSVHDILMLCHIRQPPQVETKVDREKERHLLIWIPRPPGAL